MLLRGRRSLEVARVDRRVGGRWQRAGGMGLRGTRVVLTPRRIDLLAEVGGHGVRWRHFEPVFVFFLSSSIHSTVCFEIEEREASSR